MKRLLDAIIYFFEYWAESGAAGADKMPALLPHLHTQSPPHQIQPNLLPVVKKWLPTNLKLPPAPHTTALLSSLSDTYQELNWVAMPADYLGEKFATEFAYTQLIGPLTDLAAPPIFASPHIAVGFSLQAPHIFYPPHHHKAVEFYGVLTGTAQWQLDHNPPLAQPAGALILHESDVPHAMQTDNDPLLTIWAWIGDLDSPIHVPSLAWL